MLSCGELVPETRSGTGILHHNLWSKQQLQTRKHERKRKHENTKAGNFAVHKELGPVERFHDIHFVQLKSYLRATHLHLGLLLNFNAPILAIKRIIVD